MVAIVQYLSDIDLMRYLNNIQPPQYPQVLHLVYKGCPYDFSILHAHEESERISSWTTAQPFVPYKEHVHDVYHLVMFTAGSKQFFWRGRSYACRRGTLALISPGESHIFDHCAPGYIVTQEITFSLESGKHPLTIPFHELLSLVAGVPLPSLDQPVQLDDLQTARMENLFEQLMICWEHRGVFMWFGFQRIILDIFAFLIEEVFTRRLVWMPDPRLRPLLRAKEEIERRYKETLTLNELSRKVSLSPEYLCRAFRRQFGVTPLEHQRNVRIQAAQTLLRTTTMTVKQIALLTGYGDVYAFSKAFQRIAGIAPVRYRRRKMPEKSSLPAN